MSAASAMMSRLSIGIIFVSILESILYKNCNISEIACKSLGGRLGFVFARDEMLAIALDEQYKVAFLAEFVVSLDLEE